MCQLLVGLGDITVLGVKDGWVDQPLEVHIRRPAQRETCPGCGAGGVARGGRAVVYVDLPSYGRQTRLVWHKRRWSCPAGCGGWTEQDPTIAAPRHALTDRAGRWATLQVGLFGRTVTEVALELGCDWHTVNNAVIAYGTVLVDDPARIGTVTALGLDEVAFARTGPHRVRSWSTSIVDVTRPCRMLDVVEGRDALPAIRWLAAREPTWRDAIRWATLDLAGSYRKVFDTMLPDAIQVADPFHVVRLGNACVDDVRRRVQQETLGHRGRKADPLYRIRRRLTIAAERLDEQATDRVVGLLTAGDPHGEVTVAWQAKEAVRQLYFHRDPDLAEEWVDALTIDLKRGDRPPEVRRLGRTLTRWRGQVIAWHHAGVSNGPTESMIISTHPDGVVDVVDVAA